MLKLFFDLQIITISILKLNVPCFCWTAFVDSYSNISVVVLEVFHLILNWRLTFVLFITVVIFQRNFRALEGSEMYARVSHTVGLYFIHFQATSVVDCDNAIFVSSRKLIWC